MLWSGSAEMLFRLAFVAAFAFAVSVAATTARQAVRRHGGTLNHLAHEVRGLIVVRAALGLVFYSTLMAWLFWPQAVGGAYLAVPTAMRWLAVVLLLPTLAFFAWSFRTLGTSYRGGVGLHDEHELVTTGPYRRIRHPIYAAFIGIMLLVLPLTANWLLGLSGLILVLSVAAVRIPREERLLHERFGPRWERYRERAGRLLPRLR